MLLALPLPCFGQRKPGNCSGVHLSLSCSGSSGLWALSALLRPLTASGFLFPAWAWGGLAFSLAGCGLILAYPKVGLVGLTTMALVANILHRATGSRHRNGKR